MSERMSPAPLSGTPYTIEAFGYRASVASTGATLRTLSHDGRDLIAGFAADRLRPAMRGALLVPWPNRTADGTYEFEGEMHRLPVDEPETRTAVHGLLAWHPFALVEASPDAVVLEATLAPRPGYPWQLHVRAGFLVDRDGLHQEVSVENRSDRPAPVGIGGHPYLVAGDPVEGAVDGWRLEADADRVLLSSADRMLPERIVRTADRPYLDFRAGRRVGDAVLNHCLTDWRRSGEGLAAVSLRGPDGRGARIAWDDRCGWAQLYSADDPVDGARRTSLAVEPMTCPPDALNSGTDLRAVAPGSRTDAGWLISAL